MNDAAEAGGDGFAFADEGDDCTRCGGDGFEECGCVRRIGTGRSRGSGMKWCGEREAHAAHEGCDGWKVDVSLFLALRDHHRGLVKRGLKYCPRCGLRIPETAAASQTTEPEHEHDWLPHGTGRRCQSCGEEQFTFADERDLTQTEQLQEFAARHGVPLPDALHIDSNLYGPKSKVRDNRPPKPPLPPADREMA